MKRFNFIPKTAIITALLLGSSAEAQTVTGTGTANYVPMFTGTSTIGNSLLRQGTGNDANRVYSGGPLTITDANTATSPAMLYVGYSSSMLIGIGSSTPTLTNSASIMSVQSTVTGLQFSSNGAAPINGTYPVGRLTTVTTTTDLFKITNAGLTGIGLASPATQLDVQAIGTNDPFQVRDKTGATLVKVFANGNVQIGNVSTPNGYKLYVEKGILSEVYKCALKSTSDWSDYVFDEKYRLRSLEEVKSYIQENKHLPDVPAAEEVVKNGLDLAKMDAKLLQKVEELTLYIIEQDKRIKELENTIVNTKK